MPGVAVGIDFGTSNTTVAVAASEAGAPARILDIDPGVEDPRLLRSVLFFPAESAEVLTGGAAIGRYLVEGGGRLLLSIKSFLASPLFRSTDIRKEPWSLEELVAEILRHVRLRVEACAGARVERLVLGRPAVFSPDPELDAMAVGRLSRAAERAGFPKPEMVIEPFAAALEFEASLTRDTVVLVADFGAGTSDFTLMRLGPSRRGEADRGRDVLASTGLHVGGDRFDAAIVENRLLPIFGHGSSFKSLTFRQKVPVWITRKLLAWHELSFLCEPATMRFLERVVKSSDAPRAVRNLMSLAEENLGFHLFRAVEATKRALSVAPEATIAFRASDIEIEERVTREEFEAWTAPLRDALSAAVDQVLAEAGGGIEPEAVFITGGCSRVPSVRRMFVERFGEGRLCEADAFTSVAAGLGRAAGVMGGA